MAIPHAPQGFARFLRSRRDISISVLERLLEHFLRGSRRFEEDQRLDCIQSDPGVVVSIEPVDPVECSLLVDTADANELGQHVARPLDSTGVVAVEAVEQGLDTVRFPSVN